MNIKHYQPRDFNERLYNAVILSNLDITTISVLTNISRSSVYNYVYGVHTPNISALAKLCEVLKVSSDYLLFGKGDAPTMQKGTVKKAKPPVTNITLNGETHSVTEWSKILNLSRSTIHYRLRLGLSPEEVLSKEKKRKCNTSY